MDELEKKPETPQESTEQETADKRGFDNRRKLMYLVCGGYLIYLAVKLGKDYPALAAAGVWSGERIAALCGAIGFSIIGAALIVTVAVHAVRDWKQPKQETKTQTEEHTDE